MVRTEPKIFLVAQSYDSMSTNTPAGALFHETTGDSTITSGEISIIDAETGLLATTSAKVVQFAYFDKGLEEVVVSPPITRANVISYRYTDYTAPVKQVWTVQMTSGGSGIDDGLTYLLKVQPKNWVETNTFEKVRTPYSIFIPSGTANPDQYLAAAFRDLINADPGRVVDATAAGDTLTLTAREFGIIFEPFVGTENWVDPVKTETVAWVKGSGAGWQVLAEEQKNYGNMGNVYREHNVIRQVPTSVYTNTAVNYDSYTIKTYNRYDRGYAAQRAEVPVIHQIYMNEAGTNQAAFKTLMDSLFA